MNEQLRVQLREIVKDIVNNVVLQIEEEINIERNKPRRLWERKWITRRKDSGASNQLLKELAAEDPTEYRYALRMNEDSFNTLLTLVAPNIQKSDTFMRCAVPAKIKLHTVLYMLANGNSLRSLQHIFRVPKSTISKFIPDVCDAIYSALKDNIKVPNSHEEWKVIERGFRNSWNFPGCCGAIDGKHVVIKAPCEAGSYYYNYKNQNSIVLMAVVDHDYCFTYFDIGCNGRISDGGVFNNCSLSHALHNNLLPEGHFLVGDNAFPLKTYLLKPYGGNNLTYKQKVFNYRLSRSRRIVENAFGILASRFRIFEKAISFQPDKVEKIIKTCLALHNWLRKTQVLAQVSSIDTEDTETGAIIEGSWRNLESNGFVPIQRNIQNRSSQNALNLRNNYADYFVGEGAVSWQSRMVF